MSTVQTFGNTGLRDRFSPKRETTLGPYSVPAPWAKGLPCERHDDHLEARSPFKKDPDQKKTAEEKALALAVLEAKRRFNSLGPKQSSRRKTKSPQKKQVEATPTRIFPDLRNAQMSRTVVAAPAIAVEDEGRAPGGSADP